MAAVKTKDIEALLNVTEFTLRGSMVSAYLSLPLTHTYNITVPASLIGVMK